MEIRKGRRDLATRTFLLARWHLRGKHHGVHKEGHGGVAGCGHGGRVAVRHLWVADERLIVFTLLLAPAVLVLGTASR